MRFAKLKILIISTCVLLLVASVPQIFGLAGDGLADTAWPTYGYDLQNTGQSPYVGPQEPIVKWAVNLDGGFIIAQPVIGSDGTIYIPTSNGLSTFYAINPDGTVKWSFQTSEQACFETTAVMAEDGTVYVGMYYLETSEGVLLAFDSEDGDLLWTFDVPCGIYVSPKIGADGTIYFADETTFYAVNPDGTEKWSYNTDYCWPWYTSLAIGTDGTIYLSVDYSLYAFNPNGTIQWTFDTNDIAGSTAIGADGTIYITEWSSVLYAVNPDGTEKWSNDSYTFEYLTIGADGTIYTTATTGIYAFNSDGVEQWHFPLAEYIAQAPITIGADGTLYFGTAHTSKVIYALNSDGTEKWHFDTEYYNVGSGSIASDGTLYFPSGIWSPCTLYAFEGPAQLEPVSSSLTATADVVISMVGIELDRDDVDYGNVAPGESSAIETVGVTNIGTVDCDVTLEVVGADTVAQDFYEQSLYVDGGTYDADAVIASIPVAGSEDVDTQLQVPLSWSEPGVQEATFVFWAEAQ